MNVKQFVAPTMEQAAKAIRAELGSDAVILHSREVRTGGLFGFFEKKQYQVTAGIEEPNQKRQLEREPVRKEQTVLQKKVSAHLQLLGVEEPVKTNLQLTSNMLESSGVGDYNSLLQRVLSASLDIDTKPVGEKKLVFIAGPTGVGKTTTMAKLAAKAIFTDQKKVAFITLDTYRIAAVDQLKRYGDILECPVHVAYDEMDLMRQCESEVAADLIFIDTAGRNYLEQSMSEGLLAYITAHKDAELYLAISLAAKTKDLLKVIAGFGQETISGLILTKKDETQSLGTLLELLYFTRFPIVCITTGQNVPEDICFPDKKQVLEWLSLEVK